MCDCDTAPVAMLAHAVPLSGVAQLRHVDPQTTTQVSRHSLGEHRQHAAASIIDRIDDLV